jgi:hypothetical protein
VICSICKKRKVEIKKWNCCRICYNKVIVQSDGYIGKKQIESSDVISSYLVLGSLHKVSSNFGTDFRTVASILKKNNIPILSKKTIVLLNLKSGALDKLLRKYDGIKMSKMNKSYWKFHFTKSGNYVLLLMDDTGVNLKDIRLFEYKSDSDHCVVFHK